MGFGNVVTMERVIDLFVKSDAAFERDAIKQFVNEWQRAFATLEKIEKVGADLKKNSIGGNWFLHKTTASLPL